MNRRARTPRASFSRPRTPCPCKPISRPLSEERLHMRKSVFLAATIVAAITVGSALATNRSAPAAGIVVGSQHGVLLVSSPSGIVHTFAGHASIGDRITIAGTRIHVTGRVHRAVVRGVVV